MVKKSQIFKDVKKKKELKIITCDFIKRNLKYDSLQREYMIDESLYKHIYQVGHINMFRNEIASYYYDSKQGYIVNMNSFKGILTVLRQLSNYLKINYRYKIKYLHSNYSINYYFDLESNLDNELSMSNTS